MKHMKPFVLLGEGQTDEGPSVVKEFGPAGSLERLDVEAAREAVAEGDPKVVAPVELRAPAKPANLENGSDLSPTAGG